MNGFGQHGNRNEKDSHGGQSQAKPIRARFDDRSEAVKESAHADFEESTIVQPAP